MAIWSSYGVGRYQSGEGDALLTERLYQRNGTKRLCMYFWGHGNNGLVATSAAYWLGLQRDVVELAGVPLASADYGSATHWGNDTAITRVNTLRTYANGILVPKTDKVLLVGISMGAVLALNWAKANPTQVAAIALVTPAIDLTYFHPDGTYGPEIDTAYGGSSAYTAALPTHNPAQYASQLASIPTRLWTSSNDTTAPPSQTDSFVTASGAVRVNQGAVGHNAATTTGAQVAAFLSSYGS